MYTAQRKEDPMKKTVPLCLLSLVLGSALGLGVGQALPAALPLQTAAAVLNIAPTPLPAGAAPLDTRDNGPLLEQGQAVLDALKQSDYAALAQLAHPELGVRFTPYSTVDIESDLVLSPERLAAAGGDSRSYTWGVVDGRGSPLVATIAEYFASYVFNADYTQAPMIGVDQVLETGNALENAPDAYPGDRFVDYYFPGLDPVNEGFDWCSLKLVFREYQGTWRLVGAIHSQWTI